MIILLSRLIDLCYFLPFFGFFGFLGFGGDELVEVFLDGTDP